MSSHTYLVLNTNQSEHVIPQGPEWTKEDNRKRQAQMEAHLAKRKQMSALKP